jgi:type II secretory pathway pseudopilin PulG
MFRRAKNDRGMTLVEVVVAMAVVIAVVVAMTAVTSQSSVFSRSVDAVYTASYLAQRRTDMLQRLEFDQLEEAEEDSVRIGADGNMDANGEYLRTTEVDTSHDGNPYLTKVKISVRRARIFPDGGITDSSGQTSFIGNPVVIETLFADVE